MRENLYLAIGKYREQTKKTQGEIGLEAGITESRLCHMVKGRMEPTPTEKKKLAKILGVSVEKLFGDCKAMPQATSK